MTLSQTSNAGQSEHASIALEQSYLGSIFVEPSLYRRGAVSVNDFTTSLHRTIYRHLEENGGQDLSEIATALRTAGRITEADIQIIGGMVDGLLPGTAAALESTARGLRELTAKRKAVRILEGMTAAIDRGRLDDVGAMLPELQQALGANHGDTPISKLADIPNPLSLNLPETEWVVPGIAARNHLTMITGAGGCAKSLLAGLCMGYAVATGTEFLGRRCRRSPVLVLDFENSGRTVQDRLTDMGVLHAPDLHIWGPWLSLPPPLLGSQQLLDIAKKERPLITIDPLRLAHTCGENDSDQMATVMRHAIALKCTGSAVVLIHHTGKGEGSTFRGSSAIRDLVDVHIVQERTQEGFITLKTDKARIGEMLNVTLSVDWDRYAFTVTDNPVIARRRGDEEDLLALIEEHPGINQSQIIARVGGKRQGVVRSLRDGIGRLWTVTEQGPGKASLYFPVTCSLKSGTGREQVEQVSPESTCSPVPFLKREQGTGTEERWEHVGELALIGQPGRYPVRSWVPAWIRGTGARWRGLTPEETKRIVALFARSTGITAERLADYILPIGVIPGSTLYVVSTEREVIEQVWPCVRKRMGDGDVMTELAEMGVRRITYQQLKVHKA